MEIEDWRLEIEDWRLEIEGGGFGDLRVLGEDLGGEEVAFFLVSRSKGAARGSEAFSMRASSFSWARLSRRHGDPSPMGAAVCDPRCPWMRAKARVHWPSAVVDRRYKAFLLRSSAREQPILKEEHPRTSCRSGLLTGGEFKGRDSLGTGWSEKLQLSSYDSGDAWRWEDVGFVGERTCSALV